MKGPPRSAAPLAILAGLLVASGYFIPGLVFILPVLGVALMWRVALCSGRYRHGFLFGLACFLPTSHWLGVFVGRWTGSILLYGLAWGLVALGLAAPLATIVPIGRRLLGTRWHYALALVWIALELFRSYVPVFAFPWGLIAGPLAAGNGLSALSSVVGVYGSGGILVLLSLWLAKTSEEQSRELRPRLPLTAMGAGLVVVVIAEFALPNLRPVSRPDLNLAAYGPGLDLAYGPYAGDGPGRSTEIAARLTAARKAQDRLSADLVVLPEGLISSRDPSDLPNIAGPGTLLLGGQRHEGGLAYQTAFAYDGTTGYWNSADKTRLVIFGEFVPGRGVIPYPPSFALPGGDLAAASKQRMIDAHTRDGHPFRIGPILCFEALFPDIAYRQKLRGADVLAVMSLDDWFGGTMAPEWLEWASRWRAAETGLPLVRVGSLGRTAIIDGRGKVQRSLPWGESGAISWNPAKH